MNQQITWKPVNHPDILPGYLVSPEGYIKFKDIKDDDCIKEPSYHSTNGYDFMLLNNKDMTLQLFPLDDIIAMAYIPIPSSLKDKPIKVSHINGDTRDISLDNLQWVEDIEEWRVCTYPGVKPNMYEVSSWGRVRNKKTNNMLNPSKCINSKYLCVRLMHLETSKHSFTHLVHSIVCHEFVKNHIGSDADINHINGCGLNNNPKNIEYVSHLENSLHAINTSLKHVKLTDSDVKYIWECLLNNNGNPSKTLKDIHSAGFKHITYHDIFDIKRMRSYSRITSRLREKEFRNMKLSISDVKMICELLISTKCNRSPKRVFEELKHRGIDHIPIQKIYMINGKFTWKHISDKYFRG